MKKKSLLQTLKTSDGRPWGDVSWHELEGIACRGAAAQELLDSIKPPPQPADPIVPAT
jgi:hypothetical protein